MILDIINWKTFKLTDLFDISGSKTTPKRYLNIGGEYEYVTTKARNNGVEFNTNTFTELGNCITVDSAVIGFASVRRVNFSASDHVEILRPKIFINIDCLLFISVILNYTASPYSYSRKRSQTRLFDEIIRLPVTTEGEPDWEFMENYIEYIQCNLRPIKKLKLPSVFLDVDNWKTYSFLDIFSIRTSKDYGTAEANANPGVNNFIGSSEFNNGITAKTSLPNKQAGGCITVAKDGSVGSAFYQSDSFSVNGHVNILNLINKELTKNIGLFLCTLIKLEGSLYSFSRAWGLSRMAKSTIKLPVTTEGEPDWEFMENYIGEIIE